MNKNDEIHFSVKAYSHHIYKDDSSKGGAKCPPPSRGGGEGGILLLPPHGVGREGDTTGEGVGEGGRPRVALGSKVRRGQRSYDVISCDVTLSPSR